MVPVVSPVMFRMSVLLVPVVEQFCILSILTQYVSNTLLLFPLTLIVKESALTSSNIAFGAEGAETAKNFVLQLFHFRYNLA